MHYERKLAVSKTEVFKQLGWMSIEQRIKYHKYLLVSKCLKNEAPVYLKNKIQYLSDRNPYSHLNNFPKRKIIAMK
jgi:hypothetical protein